MDNQQADSIINFYERTGIEKPKQDDAKKRIKAPLLKCPSCQEQGEISEDCFKCKGTGEIQVPGYKQLPPLFNEILERYKTLNPYDPDDWHGQEEYEDYARLEAKINSNICPACAGNGELLVGLDRFTCPFCEGLCLVTDWKFKDWHKNPKIRNSIFDV